MLIVRQCNRPAYVGNDTLCARDLDQDSFPNVNLDCTQPECTKVCVYHITQSHSVLNMQDECPDIFSRLPDGKQNTEVCQLLATGK